MEEDTYFCLFRSTWQEQFNQQYLTTQGLVYPISQEHPVREQLHSILSDKFKQANWRKQVDSYFDRRKECLGKNRGDFRSKSGRSRITLKGGDLIARLYFRWVTSHPKTSLHSVYYCSIPGDFGLFILEENILDFPIQYWQ